MLVKLLFHSYVTTNVIPAVTTAFTPAGATDINHAVNTAVIPAFNTAVNPAITHDVTNYVNPTLIPAVIAADMNRDTTAFAHLLKLLLTLLLYLLLLLLLTQLFTLVSLLNLKLLFRRVYPCVYH